MENMSLTSRWRSRNATVFGENGSLNKSTFRYSSWAIFKYYGQNITNKDTNLDDLRLIKKKNFFKRGENISHFVFELEYHCFGKVILDAIKQMDN